MIIKTVWKLDFACFYDDCGKERFFHINQLHQVRFPGLLNVLKCLKILHFEPHSIYVKLHDFWGESLETIHTVVLYCTFNVVAVYVVTTL